MEIYPAIDLRGGQVVRLVEGDYQREKQYSSNPMEILTKFREEGARNLHIVDLDGAKEGTAPNFALIQKLVKESGLFTEVGGGIRDEERIKNYLDAGVNRVILGTVAAQNPLFVKEMVERYGDKIAVGIDAKDGKVAVNGWRETTELNAVDYTKELSDMGVATIIFTDISKDGKMGGTNLEIYQALQKTVTTRIIASGGISYEEEISKLREMGVYGAIVGKALYEKGLELSRLIRLGDGEKC